MNRDPGHRPQHHEPAPDARLRSRANPPDTDARDRCATPRARGNDFVRLGRVPPAHRPGAGRLVDQGELRLSDDALGEILGIWALGYLCFQLPGGWLGDRFGRRVMLPLYGLIWSACTIGTAVLASFAGLWWSRLIFGMAQGGLIPCLTRACVDWFPESRRGTASAALNAGMSAGAVAASGLSALLLPWLGWRLTLQLFALVGVAWAVGFWIIFRDRPEQHPRVNPAELALIRDEGARSAPVDRRRSRGRPRAGAVAGRRRTQPPGPIVSASMGAGPSSCSMPRPSAGRTATHSSRRGSRLTWNERTASRSREPARSRCSLWPRISRVRSWADR